MPKTLRSEKILRWRKQHMVAYDSIALFVYMLLAYAWGLGIHPLGRDYAHLAGTGDMRGPAAWLFRQEVALFDSTTLPYHAVNLLLLYASMLLLYRLTRHVTKGPLWLGNLAAVLFMANPAHSEAVLNLSGVKELLPCLAALAALVAYAGSATSPTVLRRFVLYVLFALVLLVFPENLPLILVIALYEVIVVEPGERSWTRFAVMAAAALVSAGVNRAAWAGFSAHPAVLWVPLYLVAYPIGFLPETAREFHAHPWVGWLAAATVLGLLFLLLRKAKRPAILFALLAMAAMRLAPTSRPIDMVHMAGGGQLLLASAFFGIAVSALFLRMMEHPRWKATLVAGTTLIGMLFIGMQIHANLNWKQAGRHVRAFQAAAEQLYRDSGEPVGILPDWRYCYSAPIMLAESITFDTPFSRRVPYRSLLELHCLRSNGAQVKVESWSDHEGIVSIPRDKFLDACPWPYTLARPGVPVDSDWVSLELLLWAEDVPDQAQIRITPLKGFLPKLTAPIPVVLSPAKGQ